MSTNLKSTVIIISIVYALIVSVNNTAVAAELKKGGTLVVALASDLNTMIPSMSYGISPIAVSYLMHNALVDYDMNGQMIPDLAESWTFSADGRTWTFRLRKGVKWHDGKDFTSADVAFTIKEVAEKLHPLGKQAFEPVSEIQTPDSHTVVFKFETPYFPTSGYLSSWYSGIVPKHLYEGTDIRQNPYNMKPVGTGPFRFQEYQKGSHLTVVRNTNYWKKDKPILDRVIFRIIPDANARVSALEKGEVDVLIPYSMPFSEMVTLKEKGFHTEPIYAHDGLLSQLHLNLRNKYLARKEIRQAIAHAIDLSAINQKAYFGLGRIPVGPIPSSIPWAFTGDVKKYEFNISKANKILDDAGLPKGASGFRFSVDFPYVGARSDFDRVANIIKSQLIEVGIDVKLRSLEYAACQEEGFVKGNFDFMYWSLTMGPNPSVGTARLFITSQIKPMPFTNSMHYSNKAVDELFEKASKATSESEAGNYFKQIQKILAEDLPMIPILEVPYPMAWSKKIAGLPEGPYWIHRLENTGYLK